MWRNAETDLCEGNYCEEAEGEAQGGVPVEMMGQEAQGNEEEEDIEPGLENKVLEGRDPGGVLFLGGAVAVAVDEGRLLVVRHGGRGSRIRGEYYFPAWPASIKLAANTASPS